MHNTVKHALRLEGNVDIPGDKSISQRSILLNSIANGPAYVSNVCVGDDRSSILRCMRNIGSKIRIHSPCKTHGNRECFHIQGNGPEGMSEPDTVLNAGNSGTTTRLVTGLLATLPFFSVISGDRSLRSRPMDRIIKPLTHMGAQIVGRSDNSFAPLAIHGGLLNGVQHVMPIASAQVKSSLLIAGINSDGKTTVIEPSESRDHTERLLVSMGAKISTNENRISVERSLLRAIDINVPGDISSAAFWIVAGCIHSNARLRVLGVGINPTRAGIISILKSMGGKLTIENQRVEGSEPVADIVVESSQLVGAEIDGDVIPRAIDELPIIALAASLAKGTTVIKNAKELRVKESDRIMATVDGLSQMGAQIEEQPDGMRIYGVDRLTGAICNSHGDHRIAMTMAVAGLVASGKTVVTGSEAVNISYPNFWNTMNKISNGQV